ncbi:unnamed protein product [Cuscuta campestris]|uniref:DDT domain-containing protein n=1 Tax=Cuscuta campestris TaxID=132261 RepID=A0A484NJD2_9ASTE|nr:unnamed protein product [Cuscuta campestris]
MAVSGDPAAEQTKKKTGKEVKAKRRSECPGVRVIGSRIYDSQNGRTCHQCRQKTMDIMSGCKNIKDGKPCTIQFCHKCLLNRYGEKAEEVATTDDWICPKCMGICNCSFCMKKRGYQPTGILVHTAKATGFTSVSEMLQVKAPGNSQNSEHESVVENKDALPKKNSDSSKGTEVVPPTKRGKENKFNGSIGLNAQPLTSSHNPTEQGSRKNKREACKEIQCNGVGDKVSSKTAVNSPDKRKFKKMKQESSSKINNPVEESFQKNATHGECEHDNKSEKTKMEVPIKKPDEDIVKDLCIQKNNFNTTIPLPQGTGLTSVAGSDFLQEDVGSALQFLEFCAAFGKILDIKRGQAEAILRDLVQGRISRRGETNVTAQFLMHLLSFIGEEHEGSPILTPTDDKGSWLKSLKELLSESPIVSKNMGLDSLDDGFDSLSSSKKLKLLNFVCDELLDTVRIRNWIDEQKSKCAEKAKEAKEKASAAREEEKRLKQKIQGDVVATVIAKNGAPISVLEHDAIVTQAKREAAEAHATFLQTRGLLLKCSQKSDAMRTEPIFMDTNGQVFWRLTCFSNKSVILLQELGAEDVASNEKWFAFDEAHQETVEKCVNSRRKRLMAPWMMSTVKQPC